MPELGGHAVFDTAGLCGDRQASNAEAQHFSRCERLMRRVVGP